MAKRILIKNNLKINNISLKETNVGPGTITKSEVTGKVSKGRGTQVLALVMFFTLSTVAFTAVFEVYPGAKLDGIYETRPSETGSKMSRPPKIIIFTTSDFFENVVAFYRSNAREYRMPGTAGKSMRLSSGQELREAYFILDDASDIMISKHWIKIQRPYLGKDQMGAGFHGKYGAAREVTAIIVEDKRTYP
jgi:hypothetical protein